MIDKYIRYCLLNNTRFIYELWISKKFGVSTGLIKKKYIYIMLFRKDQND